MDVVDDCWLPDVQHLRKSREGKFMSEDFSITIQTHLTANIFFSTLPHSVSTLESMLIS